MNFKENLREYLSIEETDKLIESLNDENKHAVLLNTKKMNDEMFLSLFPDVVPHPFVLHAYIYNKNVYDLGKTIYHMMGCFYLQEPSAMVVGSLLPIDKNERILDICAAPGGKTVQVAMRMNDTGVLISNDISRKRADSIVENIERLGIGNVIVTNNDFSKLFTKYLNYFDKIILDAPCSGSGMFRKNKAVKDDWTYEKVLSCSTIQKELIAYSYSMLKPGGLLIYSTCSFSVEEDEQVIHYLLDNSDAEVIPICLNKGFVNKNDPIGVHLFPSYFPGEGHYLCLIKKPGELKENLIEENIKIKLNKDINIAHKCVNKFGDYVFSLPFQIKIDGLNILRFGLKIGELKGDTIKYDYHFSHFVNNFSNSVELNDKYLIEYQKGLSISLKTDKGYILLKYKGINLAFGKSDGNIIKNHFPKWLRTN